MTELAITYNNKTIGHLHSCEYLAEQGAPIRADLYYVSYQLSLNDTLIEGRFTDKFLIYKSILFITAVDLKSEDQISGVLLGTRLLAIHLDTLKTSLLSSMQNGYIQPLAIEKNNLVYRKQKYNSSITMEYDQAIGHLIY
jgi:hypothetical protein